MLYPLTQDPDYGTPRRAGAEHVTLTIDAEFNRRPLGLLEQTKNPAEVMAT